MQKTYLTFLMLISLSSSASDGLEVPITIEKDIYEYAQTLLGSQSPLTIEHFQHEVCQRDVVDFILVQRAIELGGLKLQFEFELGNYDARNLRLLKDGLLLISFDTVWYSDAAQYEDEVYISDPIIRKGEYFAGIFTSPARIDELSQKITSDLSRVSIVSSQAWYVDWKTINALKPNTLVDESDWIVMAKMVSRGWVDVMLVPFTNHPPYEYQGTGYKIEAIPHLKVALLDSRHFVVSKKHPLGSNTFQALQTGLSILRKTGFIERAYQECGFLNRDVSHWKTLDPRK
ncbi:hypothetical protein NI389_16935 [Pseudoalteromonas xiamenensis]|uniref:hypothetical protein n=1 Tax=Pseudoalteromonas xiamenensis TaxID=882626 RepID=UPI0027E4978F|nr:hypothetical protein [Pseudoalteromonas xiamenensis]WMN59825.1 hypothetical protein NI389_16935 [Pseudoalteromonas xiamenensis]